MLVITNAGKGTKREKLYRHMKITQYLEKRLTRQAEERRQA